MNHAFLILAHDSPELLQRIVDKLEAPNHYIFIHLDKKSKDPYIKLKRGRYLSDEKRIKVYHGGFSMILAEIALLREALNYDLNIDYFHLMSGHDYPCVNNEVFDKFFDSAPQGRSYMHYDTDEQHDKWKKKIDLRINQWHFNDYPIGRYGRFLLRKLFDRCSRKRYDDELYAGWQWFSWHRSLVVWVLLYCDKNPEYLNRFQKTNCSDEVLFHTLLHPYIEELNIDNNNSLRYIDWYPQRKTKTLPLVLDERDFQSIQNSGALFCRKCYLNISSKLLSLLDQN